MRPRPLAVCTGVFHPHHDRVRGLALARGTAVAAHVGNDQRAVAKAKLRAMVLPDPDSLGEAERRGEPGDRLSDVGVDPVRG
jgi:hypothetical protein